MRKLHKLLFAYLLTAAFFINGSVAISAQAIDKKSFARGQRQAETIQADWLKDYLSYVASDEMEGRDTPSRGLDTTAKFIGTMLSRWGFKPAGDDGTFFQKIALLRETPDAENSKLTVGRETSVRNFSTNARDAVGGVERRFQSVCAAFDATIITPIAPFCLA